MSVERWMMNVHRAIRAPRLILAHLMAWCSSWFDNTAMKYDAFISARDNDPLRKALWKHYRALEFYFRDKLGFVATVQTVLEVQPGETPHHFAGRIVIPFDPLDEGAIFHELTHDLFEHSVFHRLQNKVNAFPNGRCEDPDFNETWGEGFCDAVRWLMESVRLPDSPWLQSYSMNAATDWRIQRAEMILNHMGRSLPEFSCGWRALVAGYDQTADYLRRTIP